MSRCVVLHLDAGPVTRALGFLRDATVRRSELLRADALQADRAEVLRLMPLPAPRRWWTHGAFPGSPSATPTPQLEPHELDPGGSFVPAGETLLARTLRVLMLAELMNPGRSRL